MTLKGLYDVLSQKIEPFKITTAAYSAETE
jgi:hypothetical protein